MKREVAEHPSEVAALQERVAALEAEQRLHRATLYSIGDAVLATDAAGRVAQLNPVAEALTGWSEDEARGRPAAEVFRILSEDTRAPVASPVERVLREGRVVGLGNHTLLVARDGTERPVADSGAPIRDDDGAVTGVVLVFRDQTEERAAQRQIEKTEERFRTFFDDAPVGKCMTAPDGRLLRLNAAFAQMLGYTREELQRLAFADITHPDDVAESRECVRCLLAGERDDWTMEKRYLSRDGEVVWTLVNTRLQRDAAGEPLRFLTHVMDITEQKTAQLALRERVKELTCLQALSDIVERAGSSAEEILAETVRILPGSWLHPDCAVARIRLDDRHHETGPMDECVAVQRAELRVDEHARGVIEVGYREPRPLQDEGPFLREERALIDALAERLGRVIERLEAKALLAKSEARFRRLAENAPDMIYRMSLPDGAYEYVSPAAERIFGYPPQAFFERPLLVKEALRPDFHEYFRQQWERLLAGEAPPTYEYAIIDRQGRTRWLNQRNVLLTDAEGRPTAIEGVVTDVTDRRRAQQELELRSRIAQVFLSAQDEDMYAAVLDIALEALQSPHGVFGYLTEDGDLVVPTMTRHIWDRCDVPNKDIVFPRDQWGESIWPRAIRQQRLLVSNERSRLTPPGHIPVQRSIAAPVVHRGEVVGLLQVANKETDYDDEDRDLMQHLADVIAPILDARLMGERAEARRRAAEDALQQKSEALQRSNEDLEQFAYVASHDLQEPLRMVSSYTQLLARRYRDALDQDARDFIDYAVDGASRMQGLIQDLLSYSRVGTRGKRPQPTACAEVLAEVLRDLEPAIEESGAEITVGTLPTVLADRTQLGQVLRNLVGNALKFRGEGPPRVEVSARRAGDRWALQVSDQGPGIDPAYHERVFEVFQRLHAPGELPGTGIGLAIVKKIVERHGGEIRLDSALGEGARFTFTLPACDAEPSEEAHG